ncbi:metallophosphoesterase [Candidatus Woesearchaeota archaeon]|nr:metallophosphoesterase [Candidatus Woesearchaeota archaeon]
MREELVRQIMGKGFLASPDIKEVDDANLNVFLDHIQKNKEINDKLAVINKDIFKIASKISSDVEISWSEFERSRVLIEKGKDDKGYNVFLDILSYSIEEKKKKELDKILSNVKKEEDVDVEEKEEENYSNVIVLKNYADDSKKREVNDFVEYFRLRYNLVKELLQGRQEMQNIMSISRVLCKKEKELVSIIGIVNSKKITKNRNILLSVEDMTGVADILINKDGKAIESARKVVEDEVIGISGVSGGRVIFATQIVFPDVPLTKELKRCDDDVYAAFISDLHFGSKLFLKEDFMKFVDWINCKSGSFLQKRMSAKIKYLFVVGDVVDGVGVYPKQEDWLMHKDIVQQYSICAEHLGMIRKDIKIILAPGQHDSVRTSEPQPKLDKDFAHAMYGLQNLTLVSNPCLVNIHSKKDFEGFKVMMYHGASYHHYIDEIDSLRAANAKDNPTEVMKFLLQKRHLAPTHASTVYIPMLETDPFFIDKLPDIIVSGEMHRSDVAVYNNITLINCSCFQAKTPFEEKVGNNPLPSRVPVMNLKTSEVKIMNFSSE